MTLRFLASANKELNDAVDFYNREKPGLGYEFLIEAIAAFDRISELPQAWQIVDDPARRCLLNRFPYGVVYRPYEDHILIVAVMHLHRRPGYWKRRIHR